MHATMKTVLAAGLLACAPAMARDVPTNVRDFYNALKTKGSCTKTLATGFYSEDGDSATSVYCQDHLTDYNVVYIQGTGGKFVNMDIDCDGAQGGPADDGRCGKSTDTQSITAFQDTIASYKKGINDVNANVHPYVVFGNDGSKSGWKTYDPTKQNIKPLSVMAVVCGDQLIYGIWADTNGDDGDHPMVGEASISLATACYGKSINGDSGHDADDVLYIAFPGDDAVPGANGANWAASNYADFEASIQALGDKLIQRIPGSSSSPTSTTTSKPASTTLKTSTTSKTTSSAPAGTGTCNAIVCTWSGHCPGAACSSDDDCSDSYSCISSKCANSDCTWDGHCLGAACSTSDDCDGDYTCCGGKCS